MYHNQLSDMEWPSKRVAPGGMLHPKKVVYSQETHKMIKLLMDEANLTNLMKKKLDWCLRSGSAISDMAQANQGNNKIAIKINNSETVRPRTSRRRPYLVIKKSGDLEREKYIPTKKTEDREKIKKRFQDIMEFGEEFKPITIKKDIKLKKKSKKPSKTDVFYDLLAQIQEREEWLQEMETLGEGEKHREVINAQIAERMRRIEALQVSLDKLGVDDGDESVTSRTSRSEGLEYSEANKINKTDLKQLEDIHLPKYTIVTDNPNDDVSNNDSKDFNASDDVSSKSVVNSKTQKAHKDLDEIKDREFVEMFKDKKNRNSKAGSTKLLKKENMRGFSIEGSPCMSSRSEKY